MGHDKDRELLVDQARRHLEAAGRPRLLITGFLAVAMAAGSVASAGFLRLGLDAMVFRYPLAVGVAYAAFLAMLRLWLARQRAAVPITDDPEGLFVPGLAAIGAAKFAADLPQGEDGSKARGPSTFDGLDGLANIGDVGAGCGAVVIFVLIAAVCTLIVGTYLVATSPVLLAELLVDGVLLGAISRAITPGAPAHWSQAVLDRTVPAAILTALVLRPRRLRPPAGRPRGPDDGRGLGDRSPRAVSRAARSAPVDLEVAVRGAVGRGGAGEADEVDPAVAALLELELLVELRGGDEPAGVDGGRVARLGDGQVGAAGVGVVCGCRGRSC